VPPVNEVRPALEALEAALAEELLDEPRPALALLAGFKVTLDEDELRGARRRAVLLLATGGDPLRGLALDGRAVTALAAELAHPERSRALAGGLTAVRPETDGLPRVSRALEELVADPELAWRAFACALLGEELAE
jgi:hypothetical protein